MSKLSIIETYPGKSELLIPSGTLTFNPERPGKEFSLDFPNDEIENAVPLDESTTIHMSDCIQQLTESAIQAVDGENGRFSLDQDADTLSVRWGFGKTCSDTEEEVLELATKNGTTLMDAYMSLNRPVNRAKNVIRKAIYRIANTQYDFGLTQDAYNPDRVLPSRLFFSHDTMIPRVIAREPMDTWLNESSKEDKNMVKDQVVDFGYSINGLLERDGPHRAIHLEAIDINGYNNIFFTGGCTMLGKIHKNTIPEMSDKEGGVGLGSFTMYGLRVQSDDLYFAADRDMNFLDDAPEICMAVVGAINKAVIEART